MFFFKKKFFLQHSYFLKTYFIYLAALSLHCYAAQPCLVADSVPLSHQGSPQCYT